jgi:ParB family transcriptional regulator, chromosome partitioning protein
MNAPLQKSRLGRGLASLIGDGPQSPAESKLPAEGEQRLVAIDLIVTSTRNPRSSFPEAELAELAESIRAKGLVQPIIVRRNPLQSGQYEIVAGERRWRAAAMAGLHSVPVIVRELSDKEMLEFAIIENVQRSDLNPIEEAGGYRDLIERFQYSQEQVAEIIGKSRPHVANMLRLLKLPLGVQSLVQAGKLSAGHARTLVGREDAEYLAQVMVEGAMSVRDAEALVQAGGIGAEGSSRLPREKDPDTKAFERELSDLLGLKIEIKKGSGESGHLVIKYGNFDQLEYVRMRLTGMPGQ